MLTIDSLFSSDGSKAVVLVLLVVCMVLFLLCGFVVFTTGRFMFSLTLLYVLVFLRSF